MLRTRKPLRVTSLHTMLEFSELKILVARRSREPKSGMGAKQAMQRSLPR